jgi:L-fuconolactonase
MRKIDAHMHWWTLAMERTYSLWMSPSLTALYRDYGYADAEPLMKANGVDGVVLVAAASQIEELGYLIGLAQGHPAVRGVVGWIDMLEERAAGKLAQWARAPVLKGIRPYLQDIEDDAWILKRELDPVVRAMLDLGLRFDALINPKHILNTIRFVERYPTLPVIVDHMAKPAIRDGGFKSWRQDMEQFRSLSHVHCKVSGLLTEDGADWTIDRIRPYVEAVVDIFGPDRLLFGSDWPVVNLVADYGRWVGALEQALTPVMSPTDQEKFWAGNATRFYGL